MKRPLDYIVLGCAIAALVIAWLSAFENNYRRAIFALLVGWMFLWLLFQPEEPPKRR
jgi:predicted membrane channel-forming protein YqfA (hemolysin III family)